MHILVSLNAVLTATTFNPSIFSPVWLAKHGFIQEEELASDYVFTSTRAQFSSKHNAFLVVPNRLEISYVPKLNTESEMPEIPVDVAISSIRNMISNLVDKLPHTPYNALGLNFAYICIPDKAEYPTELLKRVFYQADSNFMREVSKTEFNIGGYILQQWKDFSLKIEIKPTQYKFTENQSLKEGILADFNYHYAVDNASNQSIIYNVMNKWNDAEVYSDCLVTALVDS